MKDNNKTWWEKTVEYSYIRDFLGPYEIIFPLDGDLEKLSDAMVGDNLRWIVIEFKSGQAWEKQEVVKFDKHKRGRYEEAKSDLLPKYGVKKGKKEGEPEEYLGIEHHFIVYGEVNDIGDLYLKAERYFSEPNTIVFSPRVLLNKGLSESKFYEYIVDMYNWKSPPGNGGVTASASDGPTSGPSGGGVLAEYGTVFGVSEDSKGVVCMTMQDFLSNFSSQAKGDEVDESNDEGGKMHRQTVKYKKPSDPLESTAAVPG